MTTKTALESLAILIYKHDIHKLLGDDEDDTFDCYNCLMYLIDRPAITYHLSIPRLSNSKEPDICGSCFTYFGHTYSGRMRTGCHVCRNEELARDRHTTFSRISGLDYRQTDSFLCNVLYKYLQGDDIL